jgi:pilus assembly protein CpaF
MKILISPIWARNTISKVDVDKSPFHVGQHADNDVNLGSPLVPEYAGGFVFEEEQWFFEARCNRVKINDAAVESGCRLPVTESSLIEINPYFLRIDLEADFSTEITSDSRPDLLLHTWIKRIHEDLLHVIDFSNDEEKRLDPGFIRRVEENIGRLAEEHSIDAAQDNRVLIQAAGRCVLDQVLERIQDQTSTASIWEETDLWSNLQIASPVLDRELSNAVIAIMNRLDIQLNGHGGLSSQGQIEKLLSEFWSIWPQMHTRFSESSVQYFSTTYIIKQIKDAIFGFGPLQDLLRSPAVSEIMVIDSQHIFVERNGRLRNTGRQFLSDRVTENIIRRIVSRVNRDIDFSNPIVDARLPDGSRVNAVIAPVAIRGPCLTIRKFPKLEITIDDLVQIQSLSEAARDFLQACVKHHCNILISGGTGSGKTTLLNCLSSFFDEDERIVTIEDTAELQIQKVHVVSLETKPASKSGTGGLPISRLLQNALRMRPNRIVVGEVRGDEALDMLQALNTGHSGSLSTIHSNSAADCLTRLEILVSGANDALNTSAIRKQIASAIDIVIQVERLGSRRMVTEICEVEEVDESSGEIRLRSLFETTTANSNAISEMSKHDTLGEASLRPTGHLPTFAAELVSKNILGPGAFLQ